MSKIRPALPIAPLVRAACLTNFGEVARAAGLDPARLLLEAGLSPNVEDEPDLMIPVDRVGQLLQAAAVQSGNESFGLCMAESRRLSNLGAVGLLMRDQTTLRASLEVLMRHQWLLNGSLTLMLEEQAGVVVIREVVRAGAPHQPTRQRIELALGVMLRLMRQFLGPQWQPLRVCVEHAAPRDLSVHRQVLGQRMEFEADINGIVCVQADLDAPNPLADPAMARYAHQLLETAVSTRSHTLLAEVRRAILLLMPSRRCTIEQVSEHLGMAPRTVQRGLAEQGHSFSALLNEIRREQATRLVLQSDRSFTEVALQLGFSAPSAFSRWYQTQFASTAKASRAGRSAAKGLPLA